MNLDQVLGAMRAVLPFVLPTLIANGYVPADTPNNLGAVGVVIATGLWSYFSHTTSAKLAAANALPDVKKIVTVAAPADPAVAAAVSNTAMPKVTAVQ